MANVDIDLGESKDIATALASRKQYKAELGRADLTRILCEDRGREVYNGIEALAENIKANGLIEPIAVARIEDNPMYDYRVVGGGRRYYACIQAQVFDIPVSIYPAGLSRLELKRIEVAENECREDFTWQERAKMHSEIYHLYLAEYGQKDRLGNGISMRDVAKDIGVNLGALSTDIELVKAMKEYPDIAKAQTCSEAVGCMKKFRLVEENRKRVEAVMKQRTEIESISVHGGDDKAAILQAIYNDDMREKHLLCDAYVVNDFLLAAKDLPSGTFDIIEVDPPYGIDLAYIKHTNSDERIMNERQYTEVSAKEYPLFLSSVIRECTRLLSDEGWIIFWYAAQPWADRVYKTLLRGGEPEDVVVEESLLKGNRNNAIWYKTNNQSQTNNPKYNLGSGYEPFYYMRKGVGAFIQRQGHSNVFCHPAVQSNGKCHPTERPIELMTDILDTFGRPRDKVLVPFAGSGVTLLAGYNLHMDVLGFDIDKDNTYKPAFMKRVMDGEVGKFK